MGPPLTHKFPSLTVGLFDKEPIEMIHFGLHSHVSDVRSRIPLR